MNTSDQRSSVSEGQHAVNALLKKTWTGTHGGDFTRQYEATDLAWLA